MPLQFLTMCSAGMALCVCAVLLVRSLNHTFTRSIQYVGIGIGFRVRVNVQRSFETNNLKSLPFQQYVSSRRFYPEHSFSASLTHWPQQQLLAEHIYDNPQKWRLFVGNYPQILSKYTKI